MKLVAAIALVLLLTMPTVACGEAGAWQDAIARAVAKTDAAQSYRSTMDTTQDIQGCSTQSSSVVENSGDDSHSRWSYTTNCQRGSPGAETTASGNLTFTNSRSGWAEMIVIGNMRYLRDSNNPVWQENEVTAGSLPPPPHETRTPPAPPATPSPTAAPTALPPPFSPPPTSASSAPTPTIPLGTSITFTMTGGARRTTASAPTRTSTASESGAVVRPSRPGRFDILNWLVELEKLPNEPVDGVDCAHYRGSVDLNSYVDMLNETYAREGVISDMDPVILEGRERMRRQEIDVDLWIDGEDYIRQLRTASRMPIPDPDTGEDVWSTGVSTTRYFDFNEPIVIEPPDLTAQ